MVTEIKAGSRTDKSGNSVLRGGAASFFLSPATIIIIIFLVIPAFWTIYLGITNYRLTGFSAVDPEIIGLENFKRALSDPAFFNSLKVTFIFTIGSAILGQAVLGFFLAWILFGLSKRVRSTVEIIVIAAWMVPSSVVSFLWIAFLNGDVGTLNAILGSQTRWLIEYPLESIIVFIYGAVPPFQCCSLLLRLHQFQNLILKLPGSLEPAVVNNSGRSFCLQYDHIF